MSIRRGCMQGLCYTGLVTIALVAGLAQAADAETDDSAAPMFSFSGFGTLGAVHSSEDKADFTSNSIYKPDGAGHSHRWSADVDSRLGAQVTAQFTPQLSAVLQVVAEQRYDNSYAPLVEWANIKYNLTPDFSIRAGRIVLPAFLFTDTFKVGYTYPWVRPPVEMNYLLPVTNEDAISATFRQHLGEWSNRVEVNFGWKDSPLPHNGGSAKARHGFGITNTAEYGPLALHATYQETHLTVKSLGALLNAFRQFGAQGDAIADRYAPIDTLNTTIGLGASYDPGNWFVIGEWGATDTRSVIGANKAWYASGGYRYGKFTPYLIYSRIKVDSNTSDPGLNVGVLPPFLVGPATGLNAALNAVLASNPAQQTISVGGRWDFMKNVDLKLQFDHSRIDEGSPGLLRNLQPGFQRGGAFNVFSLAVDFVF